MEIRLHANARTTPKIRQYIRESNKSAAALAEELGVSLSTIHKWKKREHFQDLPHTRHNLRQSTKAEEEVLIKELYERMALSYADIVEVLNRCLRSGEGDKPLSWSAIQRCVIRCGAKKGALMQQEEKKKPMGVFQPVPFGYLHIDLKQLTKLDGKRA